MSEAKSQTAEVRLRDAEEGWVNIEPADGGDGRIQLQLVSPRKGAQLCNLSAAEARRVGNALLRCGGEASEG